MNTEQWQMLLDAFGNVANHAYQAAARQAALNAIGAAGVIFFTLFIGALLVYVFKYFNKQIDEFDKEIFYLISGMIVFIYILLGILVFFPAVSTITTYILNPDWAILQILSTLIQ